MEFNVPFVTELLGGFTSSDIEMLFKMFGDLDISRANAKNEQEKFDILSKVNEFDNTPFVQPLALWITRPLYNNSNYKTSGCHPVMIPAAPPEDGVFNRSQTIISMSDTSWLERLNDASIPYTLVQVKSARGLQRTNLDIQEGLTMALYTRLRWGRRPEDVASMAIWMLKVCLLVGQSVHGTNSPGSLHVSHLISSGIDQSV